jgi:hypothetical protein
MAAMERFRFADQGPLPKWVRIWRAAAVLVFVVLAYLVVFVDLTARQSWAVFVGWAVVSVPIAIDWMRRISEQDKKAKSGPG